MFNPFKILSPISFLLKNIMELSKNVVTDDSIESSTQDEIKLNDEKFTRVSNPFYNLINRQAKKFEEKFDFQSKLIDSLRARIEELETDSIIKGQKIKKLENEFGFEKDRSFSTRDDKSVSSVADENDKDLEIPKPDVKIPKPNVK